MRGYTLLAWSGTHRNRTDYKKAYTAIAIHFIFFLSLSYLSQHSRLSLFPWIPASHDVSGDRKWFPAPKTAKKPFTFNFLFLLLLLILFLLSKISKFESTVLNLHFNKQRNYLLMKLWLIDLGLLCTAAASCRRPWDCLRLRVLIRFVMFCCCWIRLCLCVRGVLNGFVTDEVCCVKFGSFWLFVRYWCLVLPRRESSVWTVFESASRVMVWVWYELRCMTG